MNNPNASTKDALIEAAGMLFADYGVEGTSVRAIAKKVNANIAAINYHFGSKENLYIEVIRDVLVKTRCPLTGQLLASREQWQDDPLERSRVIYSLVEERVDCYLPGVYPRWYGRLFIRLLLAPTPAIQALLKEILMPELDQLQQVLICCKPSMTVQESQLWADSIVGQITHYIFTQDIARLLAARDFSGNFRERVLQHIYTMLVKGLDLPLLDFAQVSEGGKN